MFVLYRYYTSIFAYFSTSTFKNLYVKNTTVTTKFRMCGTNTVLMIADEVALPLREIDPSTLSTSTSLLMPLISNSSLYVDAFRFIMHVRVI